MQIVRHIPTVLRVLYGAALALFGAMDLFHPMTPPPGMPEAALRFSQALAQSGYMMPLIGGVLLVGGLLVLANRFVPLALLLLAPFWVNSALFHIFLEHSGLPMVVVFVALELYLAWLHRKAFAAVLKARNPLA